MPLSLEELTPYYSECLRAEPKQRQQMYRVKLITSKYSQRTLSPPLLRKRTLPDFEPGPPNINMVNNNIKFTMTYGVSSFDVQSCHIRYIAVLSTL